MSTHDIEDCCCGACMFVRNPRKNTDGTILLGKTGGSEGARFAYETHCESGVAPVLSLLTLAMAEHPNDPTGVINFLKSKQRLILAPWDEQPEDWS